MACTIVATAGSASANSYLTIADADTYFEAHFYAETWNDADDTEKCQVLQMATRLLDYHYDWVGSQTDASVQRLRWPRVGAYDLDGNLYDSAEIPRPIEEACAEWAKQLLDADRTADSDVETQGLTSLKAGPVYMTFADASAKPVPDSVSHIVSVLGKPRSKSGSGGVTLERA